MKTFGILAINRGMWGGATRWCKGADGKPLLFDTYAEACAEAEKYRREAGPINNFTSSFPQEYTE